MGENDVICLRRKSRSSYTYRRNRKVDLDFRTRYGNIHVTPKTASTTASTGGTTFKPCGSHQAVQFVSAAPTHPPNFNYWHTQEKGFRIGGRRQAGGNVGSGGAAFGFRYEHGQGAAADPENPPVNTNSSGRKA